MKPINCKKCGEIPYYFLRKLASGRLPESHNLQCFCRGCGDKTEKDVIEYWNILNSEENDPIRKEIRKCQNT